MQGALRRCEKRACCNSDGRVLPADPARAAHRPQRRRANAAKEIKTLINASVELVERGSTLVDKAGATMIEVVASIRRVTDILGEISAAGSKQSAGVSQVGETVMQMDQATQQNEALVDQSAAAADSFKAQAQQRVQAVAVFRLRPGTSQPQGANPVALPRLAVA